MAVGVGAGMLGQFAVGSEGAAVSQKSGGRSDVGAVVVGRMAGQDFGIVAKCGDRYRQMGCWVGGLQSAWAVRDVSGFVAGVPG